METAIKNQNTNLAINSFHVLNAPTRAAIALYIGYPSNKLHVEYTVRQTHLQ